MGLFDKLKDVANMVTGGAARVSRVVRLPSNMQPSFEGHYTPHEWSIRGRIEVTGNDPDSGFMAFRMGTNG